MMNLNRFHLERLGNKVSEIESGMAALPMRELLGLDKMLQKVTR